MSFQPDLEVNSVISNGKLSEIFSVACEGGMRKSNKNNCLIIIANYTKELYTDRWKDGILHYTGMGKKGDQDINYRQNKTLNESRTNGVSIFLFEVHKKKEYTYKSQVELAGTAYQEWQKDSDGADRKVWIFPLKLK